MDEQTTRALKRFYRYEEERKWLVAFRCLLCGIPALAIWVIGGEVGFFPEPPLVGEIQASSGMAKTVGGGLLALALGVVIYTIVCAVWWVIDRPDQIDKP